MTEGLYIELPFLLRLSLSSSNSDELGNVASEPMQLYYNNQIAMHIALSGGVTQSKEILITFISLNGHLINMFTNYKR